MANRYFVNGGVDNNWSTIGNWSTTSGGAGGSAVPLSTDDVFLDSVSPNCTVNTSTRVAKTLTTTGYTNTLTMTLGINVSGSITLGAGMFFAGTAQLASIVTSTITSNGITIPTFGFGGTLTTFTLADAMVVSGTLTNTPGSGTSGTTINGFSITIGGGLTCGTPLNFNGILGTTTITMNGTGTLQGYSQCQITVNTAGTITFGALFSLTGVDFVYTAGTMVTTACALILSGTQTIDFNAQTFLSITIRTSLSWTATLGSDLITSGSFTHTANAAIVINSNNLKVGGSFSLGFSTGSFSGTAGIVFNGTGTITTSAFTTGFVSNNITFNSAGTITFSNNTFNYKTGTITYTAGTMAMGTSTLALLDSTTLATSGMSWYNVTCKTATQTLTLSSNLTATNSLTISASTTFTGAGNFTTANLLPNVAGITVTFKSGTTYTVTTNFTTSNSTELSKVSFVSSIASTDAFLNLQAGAIQDVMFNNATDINSIGGQTIYTYKGTLLRTTNWSVLLTQPPTMGHTFVN